MHGTAADHGLAAWYTAPLHSVGNIICAFISDSNCSVSILQTLQVRHVFSGAVQSGEGGGPGGANHDGNARDLLDDLNGARTPTHAQTEVMEDILEALKRVADEQTTEIAHICRC